jgi:hypothetical protein
MMETIREELHMYVCDSLAELGKDMPVTEAIIMDCVPMLKLWTKNQSSTTKDFTRAVKDIKPRTVNDYISVREWSKAINLLADDYGWSLRMRVTFMRRTGGLLAAKQNDNIARRHVWAIGFGARTCTNPPSRSRTRDAGSTSFRPTWV